MRIIYDRDKLQNFDFSIGKEWLEINNLGAYACSTLYGLNSQCYHGLLAVSSGSLNDRLILLSKFEDSVFIEHHIYEISANQYTGAIYPDGYKYLRQVSFDPFPRFTYIVNQQRLEKTLFLLHDQNTLVMRYVNKNQGPALQLILKPIIAYRKTTELSHQLPFINTDSYLEENMVRFLPKAEMPALNIFYLKGKFTPAPLWYFNYKYFPGYIENVPPTPPPVEDLLNPGFFSCTLETYEALDLFISVERLTNLDYEDLYRREKEFRNRRPKIFTGGSEFMADLTEKLRTSIIPSGVQPDLILPSYHHYQISTRDMLLSLPGLTLLQDDQNVIKRIIARFLNNLADGLLPFQYPFGGSGSNDPYADNSLLLINFLYFFYGLNKDNAYLEQTILNSCLSIIEAFKTGTRHNIYADKDDLIFCGDQETTTSWIPLRNQAGQVLRYGKLLEINALWYNALRIMEFFYKELGKKRMAKRFNRMAVNCRTSFLIYFWDKDHVRFYDLVRENYTDRSFRINQLFLIALPFPIVDTKNGANVLQQVETELLTPYGLRSLSPRDEEYTGKLEYRISRKNSAFYRGAVWPWTVGLYVDAVLRFRGRDAATVDRLREYVNGFAELFYDRAIGYIPEICEGDEPHRSNGTLAHSLNLIELLRALYTLENVQIKKTAKVK
jgi:predicted glycogen debranching enzyme